ncbi:hypothetical protein [Acetobacteroides hydrogenigenes]|uniref:Uncharacterized protein n=1 Tax=Acetobacteroides hydrogenigenes TaxID=979970 RepID=A0A4R2EPE0_9BACT|nr:hypothetical protein [Acetobacteroides hydrogenigenes]TCN68424.1 hypothetical protein CLV25_1064 [Acetobacteroides hydrogenigenes]
MNSNLLKKMKIKEGMVGKILNTPPGFEEFERYLQENGYITTSIETDFTLCFVTNEDEILSSIPFIYELRFDGLLWMIFPKKRSKIQSSISKEVGWEPLHEIGYKDIAIASINENWAALRFRSSSLIKSSKRRLKMFDKVANHRPNRLNSNIL